METKKMTVQEAMQILTNVCVNTRGVLQEHQAMQTALETVGQIVFPKPQLVKDEPEPIKE